MRQLAVITAAIGLAGAASAAEAADKLVFAPPAPWVVPVALPATAAKSDAAAIKLLLVDEQVDLQPGVQTRYSETAYRIQTPQGLAAGAVNFAWNPDHQTVTVHKLLIRRGTQVIDVLAGGQQFTVVRRESNLENAVLDGELTATIQPEGVQVGDVIDFTVSVADRDPAIGRHIEQIVGTWNGLPVERAHVRVQWPSGIAMHLRAAGGVVLPKQQRHAGMSSIEISQDDVQPLNLPKGAPRRFHYGRLVELSDFARWSETADLLAPLFAKAAVVASDDPLNAEITRIRAASTDPVARATAALALVQDRVRYVALLLDNGGLVPAAAGTTWSRRFGDCKGKTVLLLAMLHSLGIEAEPVLVSARAGDGLDQRLPLVAAFDHVLVRAQIGGVTYWLDGTRTGDRRLDRIVVPGFTWGLPLAPGAALVAMVAPPLAEPGTDVTIRLDATAGITLPAMAHVDYVMRGDVAAATNLDLANLTGETRDRALKTWWKQQFEFIEPKTMTTAYDADTRVLTLVMDGSAKLEWNDGYYEADKVGVGYTADFARDAGPDRDAPFAVGYPSYFRAKETILLPPGNHFTIYKELPDVDTTVAGIAYKRHATLTGNRFTVDETERAVAPEFAAADAPAAQLKLRELAKQVLYIKRPDSYRKTSGEIAVVLAKVPATAPEFLQRSYYLLQDGRFQEAVAALNKALVIAPGNVVALANRSLSQSHLRNFAAAQADIDAASAIDPRNNFVWQARGYLAEQQHDTAAAIAGFTKALEINPGDDYSLARRAYAYVTAGQQDLALADAAAALRLIPNDVGLYLLRANILRGKGDTAGVVREAAAAVEANPDNDYALVTAARIYGAVDRRADAMATLDRALKLAPSAFVYVNRANVRTPR